MPTSPAPPPSTPSWSGCNNSPMTTLVTDVITKGRGNYWNINANKAKYKQRGQLGIGVINASETNLVDNLKHRVVGYLCKSTQFVSLRPPEGLYSKRKIKTIRRGEFPVKPPKKLGRPRKTQVLP